MYHRELYRRSNYNLEQARALRSQELCKARMENRMNILQARRFMDEINDRASAATKENRAERLVKWKQEKLKALEEQKKKQKPSFRVGILQRKATGSPLLKMSNSYADKNFLNPNQIHKVTGGGKDGIVTRSRAKGMLTEINPNIPKIRTLSEMVNNKALQIKNRPFTLPKSVADLCKSMNITIPQSPQVLKRTRKNLKAKLCLENKSLKMGERNKVVAVGSVHERTNSNGDFPKCNARGAFKTMASNLDSVREDIDDSRADNEDDDDPKKSQIPADCLRLNAKEVSENAISSANSENKECNEDCEVKDAGEFSVVHSSPFIKRSRGKNYNSQRKSKISLTMDVDKFIEEEESQIKVKTLTFRRYIEDQTKLLMDRCDAWKNVLESGEDIPQEAEEDIRSFCGKAALLASDKFVQFRGLIDKCEAGDPMVKVEDLQGYQDWVSIEVNQLGDAFERLQTRKADNWKSNDVQPMIHRKVARSKKSPKPKPATKRTGATSNIRQHILAARKLKQNGIETTSFKNLETWEQANWTNHSAAEANSSVKEDANRQKKNVDSPAPKKSIPGTPASKKRISGLEVLFATQIAKCLTSGKTPVNSIVTDTPYSESEATPMRSILKQGCPSSSAKHSVRFKLSSGGGGGGGLNEKYFKPLIDDQDDHSELALKIGDLSFCSPKGRKRMESTPIRRSERLALKNRYSFEN